MQFIFFLVYPCIKFCVVLIIRFQEKLIQNLELQGCPATGTCGRLIIQYNTAEPPVTQPPHAIYSREASSEFLRGSINFGAKKIYWLPRSKRINGSELYLYNCSVLV